jgi:hypothetical protein
MLDLYKEKETSLIANDTEIDMRILAEKIISEKIDLIVTSKGFRIVEKQVTIPSC